MPPGTCLVSILIPVFNSAETLRRAAESALRQHAAPLEVLIIDDASEDGSLAEARRIAADDNRVHVIAMPENRGKPHAMNHAVAMARGDWIAVLDADDRYEDDRLAILLAAAARERADLVADNQSFLDAGAGRLVGTAFPVGPGDMRLTRQDFIAGCDPFARFDYGMLKPVVSADFIRRTGLRYRENARLSEDFLYLVEFFAAGGRAVLVPRPLYCWTQAFGTLSRRWTETGAGRWRYDFGAALAANAEMRAALHHSADADLIALLDRRDRAFRRLHWLRALSLAREAKAGWVALAGILLRHPSIWPAMLGRAALAGGRRLRRRRDVNCDVAAATPRTALRQGAKR